MTHEIDLIKKKLLFLLRFFYKNIQKRITSVMDNKLLTYIMLHVMHGRSGIVSKITGFVKPRSTNTNSSTSFLK